MKYHWFFNLKAEKRSKAVPLDNCLKQTKWSSPKIMMLSSTSI